MVAFHLMYGLLIRLVIFFICLYFTRCSIYIVLMNYHNIKCICLQILMPCYGLSILFFAKLVGSMLCHLCFEGYIH